MQARAEMIGNHTAFEQVTDLLTQVIEQNVHRVVLNYHAPTGFGKSNFLYALWDYVRQTAVPVSLVSLKAHVSADEDAMLSAILYDIAAGLDTPDADLAACELPVNYRDQIHKMVGAATRAKRPTLLLLDDYDVLPDAVRAKLERDLLGPLVRDDMVVLVLTSKIEIKFTDNFDLRTRRRVHQLTTLSVDDVRQELDRYKDLAPQIHHLSAGLPTLVDILMGVLDDLKIEDRDDLERRIEAVRKAFYQPALNTLFRDESEVMQETLLALALLRRIDLEVLQALLVEVRPDIYGAYTVMGYMTFLAEHGQWMQWRTEGGGYTLHPAHRSILQDYVLFKDRHTGEDVYRDVHEEMAEFYTHLLKETYQHHYVLEALYHTWCLARVDRGMTSMVPESGERVPAEAVRLHTNGHHLPRIDQEQAMALYRALQQDPDLGEYYDAQDLVQLVMPLIAKEEPWRLMLQRQLESVL